MAFDRDLALRQLIDIYDNAYKDLLQTIKNKKTTEGVEYFKRSLLADVDSKLNELTQVADKWQVEAIPTSYKNSRKGVLNLFNSNGIDYSVQSGFTKVHKEAVSLMQQNFYDNMQSAHNFVARRFRDKLRQAQLKVATQKLTTGQTIKQMQNNLIVELSEQGITAYKDSAGRMWTLDRYAEMASRSVIGEATNKGTFNQLESMGRDLVQLTSHASPCPICAPLEGRVYSLSGKDDRFPSVDNALPNEYGIIHNNCLHRFVPYVAELADDVSSDVKRSNRPFDSDPRTAKAKEAYQRKQKINTLLRKEERLAYKLNGLDKGTDEYKSASKKLKSATSRRRELEKKMTLEDAELIDEVWTAS